MSKAKSIQVTDVILRDAHQSLIATRMRTEDMLPICQQLDEIGYWSLEVWGGATFDACIRFLKEDPWERLQKLRAALPNTRLQMLLRGQNLLGYRHYADDVVAAFVQKSADNGIDVFRVFDALNDLRNVETACKTLCCASLSRGDGMEARRRSTRRTALRNDRRATHVELGFRVPARLRRVLRDRNVVDRQAHALQTTDRLLHACARRDPRSSRQERKRRHQPRPRLRRL